MSDAPRVTITLLVYGPSPWIGDVLDAVAAHTTVPYELVVIDNGTTDECRARIARVEGARVGRPARNLGFGVGHDAAVNVARGEYVCTLNSDAIVPPGWLDALLSPFADDPTVGATAPAFVYPDGRLQEAGATVEPSGQVIAFGRFDAPDEPRYRVGGRVPFASAACLVTRTRTFREVGGFDARYGLAYYEDVDFAFALLARGLHVELVPDVRVVHAQGASSTSSADAERMLLGNREQFRRRYEAFLTGRPDVYGRAEAHHLAAARDFDVCDRVFVVSDEFPDELVGRFVARLRDGRVTVATSSAASPPRGVEIFERSRAHDVLRARRFHYAAVVDAATSATDLDTLDTVVRDTQPQAVRADAPTATVLHDAVAFDRWVGSLDLVPRLGGSTVRSIP